MNLVVEELKKDTKNFKNISIKLIDKKIGKSLFIKNHYSHKNVNTSKYYLGLFQNNNLYGSASFGIAMNPHSCSNIVKDATINDYLELNRLWISDYLGKNIETIFLGLCWKWIKLNLPSIKWIQSFADGRIGTGVTYQASNFIYCGYHISRFWRHRKTGEFYHDSLLTRKTRKKYYILQKMKKELEFYPVKVYRYLYFLNKKERKNLKLKSFPYPKQSLPDDLNAKYAKGQPHLKDGYIRESYFKKLKRKKFKT